MNKQQKNYMINKAILETLESNHEDMEKKYILEAGIQNDDGTIPELIYCIDNESLFNAANEEFSKISESTGIWSKILEARDKLEKSENALIAYGLSIAPKKIRETLSKAVETNYSIKREIIDLAFKLDTKTVPAAFR